jgi:hypothetical protein
LLQWEVFLPRQYKVKDFGGDALATSLLPPTSSTEALDEEKNAVTFMQPAADRDFKMPSLSPGQIGGMIFDQSGAAVSGARVTVFHPDTGTTLTAVTDDTGRWVVSNVPSGRVRITTAANGFNNYVQEANYDAGRPLPVGLTLRVGSASETVTVETRSNYALTALSPGVEKQARKRAQELENAASANVTSLQQRVAGVLPVAVDVPRAGNSYRFVRPLVLDEETKVTFTYKTK